MNTETIPMVVKKPESSVVWDELDRAIGDMSAELTEVLKYKPNKRFEEKDMFCIYAEFFLWQPQNPPSPVSFAFKNLSAEMVKHHRKVVLILKPNILEQMDYTPNSLHWDEVFRFQEYIDSVYSKLIKIAAEMSQWNIRTRTKMAPLQVTSIYRVAREQKGDKLSDLLRVFSHTSAKMKMEQYF